MVAPASGQPIRLAAITDEFSPDIDVALDAMRSVGMTGVELRTVGGRNVVDLSDSEIAKIAAAVTVRGMEIVSIASPLLKCVLPDAPPVDTRFQQDVFGSPFTFDDQPRLTSRVFEIARLTTARIVRVFSYWRTIDPPRCEERIVVALQALAEQASTRGVTIGLENRYHYHEYPDPDEMAVLLADYPPEVAGFWLDVGHGEVLDRLGFLPHTRWLDELAERCVGTHVHDVDGLADHRAPGFGTADWPHYALKLPPHIPRVNEINQRQDEERVGGAIAYLHKVGAIP